MSRGNAHDVGEDLPVAAILEEIAVVGHSATHDLGDDPTHILGRRGNVPACGGRHCRLRTFFDGVVQRIDLVFVFLDDGVPANGTLRCEQERLIGLRHKDHLCGEQCE